LKQKRKAASSRECYLVKLPLGTVTIVKCVREVGVRDLRTPGINVWNDSTSGRE